MPRPLPCPAPILFVRPPSNEPPCVTPHRSLRPCPSLRANRMKDGIKGTRDRPGHSLCSPALQHQPSLSRGCAPRTEMTITPRQIAWNGCAALQVFKFQTRPVVTGHRSWLRPQPREGAGQCWRPTNQHTINRALRFGKNLDEGVHRGPTAGTSQPWFSPTLVRTPQYLG